MWLLLTVIATFCFALARLLQKTIVSNEKNDPIAYSIYFQLLVALILFPVALIDGIQFPPLGQVWFGLILTALFYCLANIFSYNALRNIAVSEFTIILASIPIWTMLTSMVVLHESTNPMKLLGILLTVVGIGVAFYTKQKFVANKYHLFAFLAAACLGFAFTNDAFMLKTFKASTYSVLYFLWPGMVLGLLYYKRLKGIAVIVRSGVMKSVIPSVLFAGASLAVNNAYKTGGEISQIATITQANIIVVILLSILFLHEKTRLPQKLIGGCIVCLGVILVQMK